MNMLGWAVAGFLLLWHVIFVKRLRNVQNTRQIFLRSFFLMILLHDELREKEKKAFEEWIRDSPENTAWELGAQAHNAIDYKANTNGPEWVRGAHALLWNCDAAAEKRQSYSAQNQ